LDRIYGERETERRRRVKLRIGNVEIDAGTLRDVKELLVLASENGAIALAVETERERCATIAEAQGADRIALEIRKGQ
jgi:hypothetical protein